MIVANCNIFFIDNFGIKTMYFFTLIATKPKLFLPLKFHIKTQYCLKYLKYMIRCKFRALKHANMP